ncbi:hypothetical protein BGX31_000602 [Mortierella sp. GBA43]|nr:hypothetical protein BGX31_000602 [Mortierella sp. GBA43]
MSSSSTSTSSLRVQPLTRHNRPGVAGLIFDSHMKSVSTLFQFLRLRPVTLILWTCISTVLLKYRQTTFQNYSEIMFVFSVSVFLAQAVLFLTLLYEASKQAPGPEIVGKLNMFLDQDQDQDRDQDASQQDSKKQDQTTAAAATGSSTATSTATAGSVTNRSTSSSSSQRPGEVLFDKKQDNLFWVLEKDGVAVGSIGALVDKSQGVARLECWVVREDHRRNGCGSVLLKTAMDQLSEKKSKVKSVRVVLQGYQVPALRLFHKFKFEQLDRTPEWLGERVVLEISTQTWIKENKQ